MEEQNLSYQESNRILQLQLQILSEGGEAPIYQATREYKNILDANDSDLVQTIHQLQEDAVQLHSQLEMLKEENNNT